jgi:hypothetical protein
MNTENEILDFSPRDLWELINQPRIEIIMIGEDGNRHKPVIALEQTRDGRDSVSINWNEGNGLHGCDLNDNSLPVEVITPNQEYIVWWASDSPIHFILI